MTDYIQYFIENDYCNEILNIIFKDENYMSKKIFIMAFLLLFVFVPIFKNIINILLKKK